MIARNKLLVRGGLALALLGSSATVIVLTTSGAAQAARNTPAASEKVLLKHFSVFHRVDGRHQPHVATSDAAINNVLATLPTRPLDAKYGLQPNNAETVSDAGAFPVTAVPGQSGLCAMTEEPANDVSATPTAVGNRFLWVCASSANATAGGLGASVGEVNGSTMYFGVVPNNVATVALSLSGGATKDVGVRENAYATIVAPTVTAITLENSSGSVVATRQLSTGG